MSVYHVFIVLPVIIMGMFTFVFQSSVAEITDQQFLANCPYPTFSVLPTITGIDDNRVTYTINSSDAFANYVVVFECEVDSITGAYSANTVVYESSDGYFALFDNAFAWVGYAYSSVTSFAQKVQAWITMGWLMYNAPAEVTNLSWFTYLNVVLSAFFGFGLFMVIRGNGG